MSIMSENFFEHVFITITGFTEMKLNAAKTASER